MIRTGDEYRAGLRDGREIWIDGEPVADVTIQPAFKPIVDAKARMYDLAHDCTTAAAMTFDAEGERFSTLLRPPTEKEHWREKFVLSPASARKKATRVETKAPERLIAAAPPSYSSGKSAHTATLRMKFPRSSAWPGKEAAEQRASKTPASYAGGPIHSGGSWGPPTLAHARLTQ